MRTGLLLRNKGFLQICENDDFILMSLKLRWATGEKTGKPS
jgi:hypothetical protein